MVDVVSSYVKLVRAGSNFKAVCPFHSEKSPSFFVSPARDVWHCFGCGVGGDQFRFVMQIEGVDFREALRILADRAGVELAAENPRERSERSRLFGVLELAVRFYQQELKRHPEVESYLAERGVTGESIQKFQLGYAPPEALGWRAFTEHALKNGYKLEELEKSGLLIKNQPSNRYYDRFRNRIMFPISDASSHVIGFGGRIFPLQDSSPEDKQTAVSGEEAAKYVNTPQTPLYDKSAVLYAFDKAKVAIRKENTCIMVEGYMDALMAHQAGTENVVAVSGTALTSRQLTLVRRLCDKISMSFDMDAAGEMATRRSIDLALEIGFDVRAMALPAGKDPADLVAKDPAAWRETANAAIDIISYFLVKAFQRYDSRTLEGKRGVMASVLPLVARLPREVDKAHWVSHIASRIGVRDEAVWQDLAKESPRSSSSELKPPSAKPPKEQTRARILEERILGLLYSYGPARFPAFSENLFVSDDAKALSRALAVSTDVRALVRSFPEEHLRAFANQLIFETEMLVAEDKAEAEYISCVADLRRERLKEKLEQLTHDIRKAEDAGNAQQVSMLADEFSSISRELIAT